MIHGKPLLAWTILAALETGLGDVYVSTDDLDICAVACKYGASVIMRPENISGDFDSSEKAILHSLTRIDDVQDFVCFLQCTSPFITAKDIKFAYEDMILSNADSLFFAKKSHTYNYTLPKIDVKQRGMRQGMEQVTEVGAYMFKTEGFLDCGERMFGHIHAYIIERDLPPEIDNLLDFWINEQFWGYWRGELHISPEAL